MEQQEITLPLAAVRLGRSWRATWKLALRGELGACRQVAGRWLLTTAGVDAYCARTTPAENLAPPIAAA